MATRAETLPYQRKLIVAQPREDFLDSCVTVEAEAALIG